MSTSQRKLGYAVLGLGIGMAHADAAYASDRADLVAVCDIDEKRLRERAEAYGIPENHCFTDYRDLIACPDVDAVDISTPNNVHFEIAAAAARAGKPYGIEKPVTMDTAEALELAKITQDAGVASMIYFSYRYKAAVTSAVSFSPDGSAQSTTSACSIIRHGDSVPQTARLSGVM